MGIPTSIKTLLSGNVVEWARIEFKETWDAEASLKTICAFANDIDHWGGGYLVIGVEDKDGKPFNLKGVPSEKIDSYLKDLLNKCKQIQPSYMPITEVADYKGKKYIVVWAPGGDIRPYSSPKTMAKDNKERVYWIRKMASTIAPSEEEKRDLYSLANKVPFDDRINHEADITDLNITLIQSYLKEIGSSLYESSGTMDFVDLCKSMNIVNALPEYTKPKNVGLMFFSLTPERFFPYAQIDIVQFPEGLGGNTIIENTFKGPLHIQLRDALRYINNNIIQERVQKLPDVAEAKRFFNYPYTAIEEALANAVYHKGYDEREPIEVRVHNDRIEIVSHPGADRSISIDGLKNCRVFNRRYRNRRIGEFLKEMHLTEGRNTGFGKIAKALESNGSPKPLFETDDDRTFFAVTIFANPIFEEEPENENTDFEGNPDENEGNPSDFEGNPDENEGNPDEALNKKEMLIFNAIKEDPGLSAEKLSKKLELSKSTVERITGKLKKLEYIKRSGNTRGKWIILK